MKTGARVRRQTRILLAQGAAMGQACGMSTARARPVGDPSPLPPLPGWIGFQSLQDLETMAFRSGAALAHLAFVAADADLPLALWRDR
ncbi:MAG: hypothetical protein H5U20_07600, partial [Rhodobacteraceae bacterium]|nr:hypothetical protein [Paracoccaceae bacterium]